MKILELTLTAREPLVIPAGSAKSMANASLDYIPGTVLLGAFAAHWIRKNPGNPDHSPQFQNLFLKGDVSWGCALPLCGDTAAVPVPLCYMREKGMDGLPVYGQKYDPEKFAVFNPLALSDRETDDGLAEVWKQKFGKGKQEAKFKKLSSVFMDSQILRQPDIHKVWNIRVALGRQRSPLQGQLFGFSALASGMEFRASIFCRTEATVRALEELLSGMTSMRLGYYRSAGYGLVDIQAAWREQASIATQRVSKLDIYLLSSYLPNPPWENPLDNLVAAIGRKVGQKPVLDKTFLAYNQLEAFNVHWEKPRDSRMSLVQGSVIRIVFDSEVQLPEQLELGSGNLEGYGRILVNPVFLQDVVPQIPVLPDAVSEKSQLKMPDLSSPNWRILRDRAIDRTARKQVYVWMQAWKEFLDKARNLERPTASQRANLLVMNCADFEEMLKKSPGRQWKEAIAPNPFKNNRNEHLDEIMKSLLKRDVFLEAFPIPRDVLLPGGQPDGVENERLAAASYDLFRRELIRTWAKSARIGQMEGK